MQLLRTCDRVAQWSLTLASQSTSSTKSGSCAADVYRHLISPRITRISQGLKEAGVMGTERRISSLHNNRQWRKYRESSGTERLDKTAVLRPQAPPRHR